MIATSDQRAKLTSSSATQVFCAKEAAYKAFYGLDGLSRELIDIEVDLDEAPPRSADSRLS